MDAPSKVILSRFVSSSLLSPEKIKTNLKKPKIFLPKLNSVVIIGDWNLKPAIVNNIRENSTELIQKTWTYPSYAEYKLMAMFQFDACVCTLSMSKPTGTRILYGSSRGKVSTICFLHSFSHPSSSKPSCKIKRSLSSLMAGGASRFRISVYNVKERLRFVSQ